MKNKREQTTGIEPASSAWEADVLPMNYACVFYGNTVYYKSYFSKSKGAVKKHSL